MGKQKHKSDDKNNHKEDQKDQNKQEKYDEKKDVGESKINLLWIITILYEPTIVPNFRK